MGAIPKSRANNINCCDLPYQTDAVWYGFIDGAVGSAFNEIAKKRKGEKIADKVYVVAIVGSFKGFGLIREI